MAEGKPLLRSFVEVPRDSHFPIQNLPFGVFRRRGQPEGPPRPATAIGDFALDLAAVSAAPISMPHFTHSVRPYGDIFSVELLDRENMAKNKDIHKYHRVTHSRYEYSTPTWSGRADDGDELDPNTKWKMLESWHDDFQPRCPYVGGQAGQKESWHMTGHLSIDKRCC